VLPSMLLRKLGTSSRKNRLYQAFYALGCVVRTVFLLTMISDVKLREVIHRATNKMEQYNALEDWVRFARGGVMYEHAFEEQEKQVKYTGLLTSCVILDNTVEISAALNTLARKGYLLIIDEVAALSPYQTRHIKRFGNYEIDFEAVPTLNADDLTFTLEPPHLQRLSRPFKRTEYQTGKHISRENPCLILSGRDHLHPQNITNCFVSGFRSHPSLTSHSKTP